ncbi:OMPdecase-domain-containing protein [Chaetomidium leptoderma]|uniref:Orotidine 5'-phosphate decarboxylase n=1 Tax=Chaetomidium leptoderma TaxID=669021 RepID=A0AAN6VPS2_9PEZI|nr:OMPdecase-domain-containing protein [Chaetomidium leptoderma]
MADRHPTLAQPFAERAKTATHPLTRYLFRLIDLKASNLCLSADVTTARELLTLANKVGPSIVVLKTHYDLISGWDYNPQTGTGAKLAALARKHGFLIFEDRKFVDIGKTVQMQYTAGTARIIEWAHITNANIDAGKDMVRAMAEAAAKWKERIHYEVKTSVTVGTPVSDQFDDAEEQEQEQEQEQEHAQQRRDEKDSRDVDGRKGSIVSITTVTQSFEPADSPRLSKTNEHGDAVFPGIEEAPVDRGLLLLAQMSTKGCLMTKDYTQACVEAAREHKGFVMGYVAQETLNSAPDDNFIHMTPGCKLPPPGEDENGQVEGDGLGQQYNTPNKLINVCGTDLVIVGRGIISADDPPSEAERLTREQCDRKFPCTNCVSRNKQGACRYDTGAPTAKEHGRPAIITTTTGPSSTPKDDVSIKDHDHQPPPPSRVVTFGYANTGASTLGFLHHIETTPSTTTTTPNAQPLTSTLTSDTTTPGTAQCPSIRDRYRSLVRQLPPRNAIEKLADVYFADFNWQYDVLDRDVFDAHLAAWYRLPLGSLLSSSSSSSSSSASSGSRFECGGLAGLDAELNAWPAVVFQVCAVALLVLDEDEAAAAAAADEGGFEGLKYAGGMSFEDLARDYSDCGVEVMGLLGKRGMGLNTVLAGLLRGKWLKYIGLVTEAWHAIGAAIRDAQEIGLHRDSLDPKPRAGAGAEAVLENQWVIQRRRKTWMTLVSWDVHMASVLGRPTATNLCIAEPSLPVDAPVPKDRSTTPILPRSENDPPTPLTRLLWGYNIARPLKEILDMEKDGPCPKDFARVERLHSELLELDARTPPCLRLENPDTRFDALPECHWLPLARVVLPQVLTFELMALHRPYIFTRPRSRTEALKASLDMLHAQRLHFMALRPQMYKIFSLFFGTFDAIVLMASIYILFPKEHPDLVHNALQHFHWAVERFEAMSGRNPLAKAALGVLRAICLRLKKSLGLSSQALQQMLASGTTPSSTSPASGRSTGPSPSTTAATTSFNPSPSTTGSSGITGGTLSSTTATGGGGGDDSGGSGGPFDWNPPSDFDWASLQTIYATSDLVYHDLVGTGLPRVDCGGGGGGSGSGLGGGRSQGQGQGHGQGHGHSFGGDFGDDSVWSLLNQYVPY